MIEIKYFKGTLRNYDPVINYDVFQPTEYPEWALILPIEKLEPCEQYHIYRIHGSVPVTPSTT